ncbi:helix-turn-helix domain-containing protein [Microtetraspora malaysiensis]|uniref:helix-turn-helix domain-containing protein n=1 Tax=Microtetraspora malaysiensis TaxID=161358 RepID=UPI0008330118|nr:helix-turn-helix domain-containing protein [Microtetraspora malaysiensis]
MSRPTYGQKLVRLRETKLKEGGRPYSLQEISAGIRAASRGEVTLSAASLSKIERDVTEEPSLRHLTAIAKFFGVPVTYFVDDVAGEQMYESMAALIAFRNSKVRDIAAHMATLPEESLDGFLTLVRAARQALGVASPPDQDGQGRP